MARSGNVLHLPDPSSISSAGKSQASSKTDSANDVFIQAERLKENVALIRELEDRLGKLRTETWHALNRQDNQRALQLKQQQDKMKEEIEQEQRKVEMVRAVEQDLRREALNRAAKDAASKGEIVVASVTKDALKQLQQELTEIRFGAAGGDERQILKLRQEIMKLEGEIENEEARKVIEKFQQNKDNQKQALEDGDELEKFLNQVSPEASWDQGPDPATLEGLPLWQEARARHVGIGGEIAGKTGAGKSKGKRKGKGKGKGKGRGVKGRVQLQPQVPQECFVCGAAFADSANFCAECGAKRSAAYARPATQHGVLSTGMLKRPEAAAHFARKLAPAKPALTPGQLLQQRRIQQRISDLMDELELVEDSLLDLADTSGSEKMGMLDQQAVLKGELSTQREALDAIAPPCPVDGGSDFEGEEEESDLEGEESEEEGEPSDAD